MKAKRASLAKSMGGLERQHSRLDPFVRQASIVPATINMSDDDFFAAEQETGVYKTEFMNQFFSKVQTDIVKQVQDDIKYRQEASQGTIPGLRKKRVKRS